MKIIIPEAKPLITDPAELRLTVDPKTEDVEAYGKALSPLKIVYARQPFPTEVESSLFIAGPTFRDKSFRSWRLDALKILEDLGYKGHVFVPEDPDGSFNDWEGNFPYEEQVDWEDEGLNRADCIVFWIPRNLETLPGFTTNDEFGAWKCSGKVVLGIPPDAVKVKYQKHYAQKLAIPEFDTLEATLRYAGSCYFDARFQLGS